MKAEAARSAAETMYLHLGNHISIPTDDIIGIFDIDNVTTAKSTREYLKSAEDEGMVIAVGDDLPKSLVVCCPRGSWQRVYVSPLTPQTLLGRLEAKSREYNIVKPRRGI